MKSKILPPPPLDEFDQPLPLLVGSRVSVECHDHVTSNLKSTLVSAKVMARNLQAKEKFYERFESNNLGRSTMALEVFGPEFVGVDLSTKSRMLCIEWS